MEVLKYIKEVDRRHFLSTMAAGAAGAAAGAHLFSSEAKAKVVDTSQSRGRVSLVTGTDPREVAYNSLLPFKSAIETAIQNKQVVIKPNIGQVFSEDWLNASDANHIRGILDFLKLIYDRQVIIGEGTATPEASTFTGYENFGYTALTREYNCRLADLNDDSTSLKCIQANDLHPMPVNIIDTYIDPDVYLISAARLKNSGGVLVTLSLKNIVMGSPVHHYREKGLTWVNEKHKIHSWKGMWSRKGQSINIFLLAQMGIQPDLAVLDGTTGMEGNGPVDGTPVEHGVGLAGIDWLAVDRVGAELMGYDWNMVKYLKWCGDAGMGEADLSKITILGPDYREHIVKYKTHQRYFEHIAWIDLDERKRKKRSKK